jgi:hypothetical protein
MSNQYQESNYKGEKKYFKTKDSCGCNHKEPKKMNNLVDLQWFKILGSNKKGSK